MLLEAIIANATKFCSAISEKEYSVRKTEAEQRNGRDL
jgi:hypothetical protein